MADYTVASDFSVPFLIRQPFLRFGSFYEGHTSFEIEGFQTSTSLPSNYIVKEANISGRQNWHENEHYKGIEIALSFAYLEKIKSIDPKVLSLKDLPDNITQTALPAKVVTLLQELSTLALAQQLTPLDFSGLLVRCLSALVSLLEQGYSRNVPYAPTVFLGKRKVSFTLMDYQAILSAKQIITDHPEKDITIHSLSKEVFLNEQKLKLGFSLCYGISIGAYLKNCRICLSIPTSVLKRWPMLLVIPAVQALSKPFGKNTKPHHCNSERMQGCELRQNTLWNDIYKMAAQIGSYAD